MTAEVSVRDFVLDYFREIGAELIETEGVFTVNFPLGRRRKFGKSRRFVFDAEKAQPQADVLEPGSPFLKLLVLDARSWGGLGVYNSDAYAPGTLLFTFQLLSFSSVKKRSTFLHAILAPEATTPRLQDGIPDVFLQSNVVEVGHPRSFERVQNGLTIVLPFVRSHGEEFAKEAVKEAEAEFDRSLGRVNEYFQGLRQETFSEETRIRKRLGEIQSKLYFTEDGLRQLKLERERDRLTEELHALKKRHTESEDKLATDHGEHVERQRRRHEPKLRIRLLAATLFQPAVAPDDGSLVAFREGEEAVEEAPQEAPEPEVRPIGPDGSAAPEGEP